MPQPFRRPRRTLAACALAVLPGAAGAAALEVRVTNERGEALEHAVVSVLAGAPAAAPPGTVAEIDQTERRFAPEVIAVQTGTEVAFPNGDDVRHHVYSFSRPNDFEIELYHGEPGETVRFEHPGIVTLGCNIHDGMIGYVAVVDTPLHAVTDADGLASIAAVPAGAHALTVWHPDTGRMEVELRVPPGVDALERAATLVTRPAAARPANPLQGLFAD